MGIMRSKMANGIIRPPLLGGFLVSGGRDPPATNLKN